MIHQYCYPLISYYTAYNKMDSSAASYFPVVINVAQRILCLPIYLDLMRDVQLKIIECVLEWGMRHKTNLFLSDRACNQSLPCD
jgi:hypothetical protein